MSIDSEQTETKKKPLILIVDDQPMNQAILTMVITKMEYDYITAENGEDALEKVLASDPDLVLMDILMPVMDGYEASKNLRNRGYKKPIIAVTASDLPDEKLNCINAGMNDMLIKPFKRAEAEGKIQEWLNFYQARQRNSARADNAAGEASSTVFNAAGMLDNLMNNKEAAVTMLSRFLENTIPQLENFPAVKESKDWETARRQAHTIKGAASTLGGWELAQTLAILEKACLNSSVEEVEAAYPRVMEAFTSFKNAAKEFISRN